MRVKALIALGMLIGLLLPALPAQASWTPGCQTKGFTWQVREGTLLGDIGEVTEHLTRCWNSAGYLTYTHASADASLTRLGSAGFWSIHMNEPFIINSTRNYADWRVSGYAQVCVIKVLQFCGSVEKFRMTNTVLSKRAQSPLYGAFLWGFPNCYSSGCGLRFH